MTFKNENDHPFHEVAENADNKIKEGWTIYQKFTCQGCGARQTIDKPNAFYTVGQCEECKAFTDIVKHGCNFLGVVELGGGDNDDCATTRH